MPLLDSSRERRLLWLLALTQFTVIMDFMVMMPLGPFLIQGLGIDTRQFGFLVASYSFWPSGSE